MSPRSYEDGKFNAFKPSSTLREVDAATYGEVDIPEPSRLKAETIPISLVAPDIRQPRRAVPARVRGEWQGDADNVLTVLGNWHMLVEQMLDKQVEIERILLGKVDDEVPQHDDAVVSEYFDLLSLASSIRADGLTNPITTVRVKGYYLIESGERRWLAHWLLMSYVGQEFASIPAIVRQGVPVDVWRQAAENGARRPLNAIGMARQIALLIMDMYERDRGVDFSPYGHLVLPGGCDRGYYAQVANGLYFPVKRGMTRRLLEVTGLNSTSQISQYRSLLTIPDHIWMEADNGNWTEFRIREQVAAIQKYPRQDTPILDPVPPYEDDDDDDEDMDYVHVGSTRVFGTGVEPKVRPAPVVHPQPPKPADAAPNLDTSEGKPFTAVNPSHSTQEAAGVGQDTFHEPVAPLRDHWPEYTLALVRLLARWSNDVKESRVVNDCEALLTMSREELRHLVVVKPESVHVLAGQLDASRESFNDFIDTEVKGALYALLKEVVDTAWEIRQAHRPEWGVRDGD